jgi:hypothetical protein
VSVVPILVDRSNYVKCGLLTIVTHALLTHGDAFVIKILYLIATTSIGLYEVTFMQIKGRIEAKADGYSQPGEYAQTLQTNLNGGGK